MQSKQNTNLLVCKFTMMLIALVIVALVGPAVAFAQTSEPFSTVESSRRLHTQPEAQTLLLVKTTPEGAEIWLDGKQVGHSNELLEVKPGTYRLVVDMEGHKPRKQKITIEDGRITRIELELDQEIQQQPATIQFTGRNTLKYDDGKPDGRRSLGGSGEMIRFTLPEGNWMVKGIQLHGSRYGTSQPPNEDFKVYLLDKDFSEVTMEEAPYRLFKRSSARWVPIRFKEPVEVPKEFWVCVDFNAERTKGVYVSYDKSTGGKNSKIGLPDDEKNDVTFGGDWMIRVDLVPAGEVKKSNRITLKHDDGKPDGKKSFGGSGQMIRYTLPDGKWEVQGIQLHGSRYGMPQAPNEDFQIYFLNKNLSKVIATKEMPYSKFRRGHEKWVRLRFKQPVKVPKEFWVCVDFNAHQTKGVYVSYDKSTGGEYSKAGLPEGDKRNVTFGGDWMIRVDLVGEADKSQNSKGRPVTAQKGNTTAAPNIVSTSPKLGATDVDPSIKEISVTFDREMDEGYSWTGGGKDFPKRNKSQKIRWRNKRTCVYPVKLEAGHYYRIGINSDSFRNFKSAAGVSVDPSELYFTTKGATDTVKARTKKPKIVKIVPANGATDVDPDLKVIRVTFDRKMGPAYSWTGGGDHFPEIPKGKTPRWSKDGKTCYLPVKLKPNWTYRLGLNSPSFKNFKSMAGVALDPVTYRFHTREK